MKKQLQVNKADGTIEEYLHTKVIGTINHALLAAGQPDMAVAEDLAEVVTYHLYTGNKRKVASDEILALVKAVLVVTGHEAAATALSDHALIRRLKRGRTEVLSVEMQDYTDADHLCETPQWSQTARWDKTRIVHDLTTKSDIPPQIARAVASSVEERVFAMGVSLVPLGLIKQLVLGEAAAMLRAQRQLQTV